MLVAIVSVATIEGAHEGWCSRNVCQDTERYLEEVPVKLLRDRSNISELCFINRNYLSFVVSEIDLRFQTSSGPFTRWGGFCKPSPSGLHHEVTGTVEKIHRLEIVDVHREIIYSCSVSWKEEAWRTRPRFISEQLMTLFLCANRLGVPNLWFCKNVREIIARQLTLDWVSFVSDGNIKWLI